MMKRLGIIILALTAFCSFCSLPILSQPTQVYAEASCDDLPEEAKEAAGCDGNRNLVPVVIINALYTIIGISGLISVIYIVIGGVKYIYSRGSAELLQEGKRAILYAVIGLIITSLAFIVVNFAINTINNSQTGGTDSLSGNVDGTRVNLEDFYSPYLEFGTGADGGAIPLIKMLSQKSLKAGDRETLVAHIIPSWLASSESITWTSDSPNIVSVDNKGNITAKQEGTATITATLSNNESAATKVTVTKIIEPSSVTLKPNKVDKLVAGRQYNLEVTVYPSNAANKHITWSTNNAAIVTVNSRGQITGKRPGKADITARTANGKTATTSVTVIEAEGDVIKITPSLLSGLEYYYQTNHLSETNTICGIDAGGKSCGPASYMAAVHVLTKQNINYLDFVNNACGKWYDGNGASIEALANTFREEYKNRYHVDIKRIPNTWDAAVAELKKGHVVIFLVHSIPQSVIQQQGYRLTDHGHYVLAISYRNQGGGQIYIWSPVSEKAAPGRNIGDCSAGQCWYDRAAFQRNINEAAWTLWKV